MLAMSELLKATDDSNLDRKKFPLPSMPIGDSEEKRDTEQDTHVPLGDVQFVNEVKTVPVMYRSFDRQYVIADFRVLDRPRLPLWEARKVDDQVFVVEQHSIHPKKGRSPRACRSIAGSCHSRVVPRTAFHP